MINGELTLPLYPIPQNPYLYPMPFHRNFTYYIDKRRWKFCFLMVAVEGEQSLVNSL